MRLPWHRTPKPRDPEPDDPRLAEAEQQVERLEDRADTVHTYLRARHDRNHWAEAIEETFRRAT